MHALNSLWIQPIEQRRGHPARSAPILCLLHLLVTTIVCADGPPAKQPPPLPRLFVLSIGVSQYKSAELTLRYAAHDARDVAALFREQKGGLYGDVEVHLLTDGDATRNRVLDELEWLARQTAPQDVAVLFIAGHGMTDSLSGQYYFMPVDAEPGAVWRSMLPASDLRTTLKSISGKGLVLIDTCFASAAFSGGGLRGTGSVDARELSQDLSQPERGIVVIAAASERQVAVEKKEWRHGAFTAALLEGLQHQAPGDRSGRVTVTGLELYLGRQVRALTGGMQAPSVAKLTPTQDFQLYLRNKFGPSDVPLFR